MLFILLNFISDKRKTIVLSAKDFAALTQKVRGNQTSCTIGVLNGTKTVPTTLRLQAPKKCSNSTQSVVPPTSVTTTQNSVPTYAQVMTPTTVPAKVPLIPCQTIQNSMPTVTAIPVSSNTVRPLQSTVFSTAKTTSNPVRREMEVGIEIFLGVRNYQVLFSLLTYFVCLVHHR